MYGCEHSPFEFEMACCFRRREALSHADWLRLLPGMKKIISQRNNLRCNGFVAAVEKLLFPLAGASASRAARAEDVLCCSRQFDLVARHPFGTEGLIAST